MKQFSIREDPSRSEKIIVSSVLQSVGCNKNEAGDMQSLRTNTSCPQCARNVHVCAPGAPTPHSWCPSVSLVFRFYYAPIFPVAESTLASD